MASGETSSSMVNDVDKKLAEMEKEWMQPQRKMELYRQQYEMDLEWELQRRLLDFDPKQEGKYYNRFHYRACLFVFLAACATAAYGPMRFTNAVYKDKDDFELCEAINIYSVKISTSDVGFPVHVYGTIIVRDAIDKKCIYLFRQDRDHCQIINSEGESLLLTGPKRGLTLIDNAYIETDLKIWDYQGQYRELSKGFLTIRGITGRSWKKFEVECRSLSTRLSTIDVVYGVVRNAVEATIAIEVIQGDEDFDGQITAHTTSIQNRFVLYDKELYGAMTGDDDDTRVLVLS
ncbi:hypothetical protein PR202_ga10961 [Eleusine coracana subsp. coracana]|uniref:DUF6598 domain-containing protein n=1 Tax=Eleusine coracana subsp. coracana TaxID=191504 RepID=A0AAV5C7W6_ELECO|nr:hypothetical protein PR202_ga10961 [Eleusine coracana subsp. coracana]